MGKIVSEITFNDFELITKGNITKSKVLLNHRIELFIDFFDIQQKLFYNHLPGTFDPYYRIQEYERIIIQSYIKNIYLLYSSHNLLMLGNYGAANILLRQIFEFLLLGKHVNIKNNNLAEKWLSIKQFDIYDNIIRLLEKPDKKSFHEFWSILCIYSHATTSSNQIGFDFDKHEEEIFKSYTFLLMFARCNYHLLNSHLINNRLQYRADLYGNKSKNKKLRMNAAKIKISIYDLFSERGKRLMKDYESEWKLKK
jgi:hypothetical protein